MELEKLYAELGRLLVQGEILGFFVIPNQGRIGEVKAKIAQALSKPQELGKPPESKTEA